MKIHLIQLKHLQHGRRVGIVEEPYIILLDARITSCYQLFNEIVNSSKPSSDSISEFKTNTHLLYDDIYNGSNSWQMLPPVDCPDDPMKCMLSGTGLTHKASAENRQKMHESQAANHLTDSMKMYLWGEEGGKPEAGKIGVQPEWFYKGNGFNLKGHHQPLAVPGYADDGGEEPEIAGIYLISEKGIPCRLGFAQANEFSDHIMEKKNYLYLAPSKIRNCSIGPELILHHDFQSIDGTVIILRKGESYWSKKIHTGENAMAHSLANLEYHHFKYAQHRLPGQVHVHFFGAGAFSFGDQIKLQEGDQMHISFENMGRPLINTLTIDSNDEEIPEVKHFDQ